MKAGFLAPFGAVLVPLLIIVPSVTAAPLARNGGVDRRPRQPRDPSVRLLGVIAASSVAVGVTAGSLGACIRAIGSRRGPDGTLPVRGSLGLLHHTLGDRSSVPSGLGRDVGRRWSSLVGRHTQELRTDAAASIPE